MRTSLPSTYRRRRAFTLVEALLAITMTAMAGAVLLMATTASSYTSRDALDRLIADGMARELMDEILGRRYKAVNQDPYQLFLGPSNYERDGNGRERYDDVDDYNGYETLSAEEMWGDALGTGDGQGGLRHPNFRVPDNYFRDWRQEVEVYYVDENDTQVRLPNGVASNYRAIEVHILREYPDGQVMELATLRRVITYLGPES